MSGIANFILFHINQIQVTFADDIGNEKIILGTGFWIKKQNKDYFVTNAHNLQPKMKLGLSCKLTLKTLKIRTRIMISGKWIPVSEFHEVHLGEQPLFHQSADVALIPQPEFNSMPSNFQVSCFQYDDLADKNWLQSNLHAMDMASFIGFPGKSGKPWFDEKWNLAIARTVNIASLPSIGYSNSQIKTTETMLVSGLSFSGSSGSAVISHEKGIRLGVGLSGSNYVEPKLVGIMSGHWWNDEKQDAFQHSGLSYLTSSIAIIDLFNLLSL